MIVECWYGSKGVRGPWRSMVTKNVIAYGTVQLSSLQRKRSRSRDSLGDEQIHNTAHSTSTCTHAHFHPIPLSQLHAQNMCKMTGPRSVTLPNSR